MRVVAPPLTVVFEVAVEQVNRCVDIRPDQGITGNAVGLSRTCQGVDLFVTWDGIVVVPKFRGVNFLFTAIVFDIGSVVPVTNIFAFILIV